MRHFKSLTAFSQAHESTFGTHQCLKRLTILKTSLNLKLICPHFVPFLKPTFFRFLLLCAKVDGCTWLKAVKLLKWRIELLISVRLSYYTTRNPVSRRFSKKISTAIHYLWNIKDKKEDLFTLKICEFPVFRLDYRHPSLQYFFFEYNC